MRWRLLAGHLAVFALFGVAVPYWKGIDFLDLFLLLPYALLSVFYVSPRAIEIAAQPPISLSALGRSVLFGWVMGVLLLALGLTTVNLAVGHRLLPPFPVLLCLLVLSLLACLLTGAAATRVSAVSASEEIAKRRLRMGFLVLLCILLAVPRVLPEERLLWLLSAMTPEGLVRATLLLVPVVAVLSLALLAPGRARYTG